MAYWLRWDGPAATSEALVVGTDVMARTNITTAASGELVADFVMVTEGFVISGDGDRIMYQAILDSGDHAMLIGQRGLGENYSAAEPNSTGAVSTTSAEGSTHAAFNAFRLETVDLPPNQFSYHLASTTQAEVPFAGGSSGTPCLGGNIGRFTDQVKSTGAAGELKIWVDLTDIPGNPPSSVQPGETWNFQAWHRDGATSNFSLPLAVTVD